MTRKHYQLIADAVQEARQENPSASAHYDAALDRFVEAITPALKADNPNFKADTFRRACGLEN